MVAIQELDTSTKERWIKGLMADYPQIDRMMAESAVELYLENPEYVDKLARGEEKVEPATKRNENYSYEGVFLEQAAANQENNVAIEQ